MKNKTKILLFPYNGNAIEAVDCLDDDYELLGFIDDMEEKQGKVENGFRIFSRDILDKYPEAKVLAVPGSPTSYLRREAIIKSLGVPEDRFVTIDDTISDYSLIGANVTVAGDSKIGRNCYIGSGSSIIDGIEIGEKSLVGLGTNIITSFPAFSKIVGNPGRLIGKVTDEV